MLLLRVPGIGIRGAQKIISSRRIAPLHYDDLKKLGIVLKRAQYFITCQTKYYGKVAIHEDHIRRMLVPQDSLYYETKPYEQLSLFSPSLVFPPHSLLLQTNKDPVNHIALNDIPTALTGEL